MKSFHSVRIARRAVPLLAAAWLLAGCASLLGGGGAATTYDLTVPSGGGASGGGGPILVIGEPVALSTLDSERIVVKPAPSLITYYGGAQWADRLPRLLQARLVEGFENARRLGSVGRPGDGLDADYQLLITLRAFEAAVSPRPAALAEMSAKIVSTRTGRIVAARIFDARVPIEDDAVNHAVAGLDRAFGQVLSEIVPWAGSVSGGV